MLYEEKLISPLAVRFSQMRIRPTFQDGYPVEDSLAQVEVVKSPPGTGYDLLLDAPFPPIEIIRWRPKLREQDGTPLEDESGETLLGAECWFTLDNRRLYCLQSVAVREWPCSVGASVRVMYDVPIAKSAARKFRTTTMGSSVNISMRYDAVPHACWNWTEETQGPGRQILSAAYYSALGTVQRDADRRDRSLLPDVPQGVLKRRTSGRPPLTGKGTWSPTPIDDGECGRAAGLALLAIVKGQCESNDITIDNPFFGGSGRDGDKCGAKSAMPFQPCSAEARSGWRPRRRQRRAHAACAA